MAALELATDAMSKHPCRRGRLNCFSLSECLAPRAGFEPATNRLTAGCSTTELPGNTEAPAAAAGASGLYQRCYAFAKAFGCAELSPTVIDGKVEATAGIEPA